VRRRRRVALYLGAEFEGGWLFGREREKEGGKK
jgi:hypothetical protein